MSGESQHHSRSLRKGCKRAPHTDRKKTAKHPLYAYTHALRRPAPLLAPASPTTPSRLFCVGLCDSSFAFPRHPLFHPSQGGGKEHTHTSAAILCVGNEPIAFLAIFDERPRGGSLKFLGPKARNFFGSVCLNDCLTTIPVKYCEVCLCSTSHLWSNRYFQALCKCSL